MTKTSKQWIALWFENVHGLMDNKNTLTPDFYCFAELKIRESEMDWYDANSQVVPCQILGVIFLLIFLHFQFLKI